MSAFLRERTAPEHRASVLLAVAALLGAVGVAAYAFNGYFTRYWADDFCLASAVQAHGLAGAQKFWYENWIGSFSEVFIDDLLVSQGQWLVPYIEVLLLGLWTAVLAWAFVGLTKAVLGKKLILASILAAETVVVVYAAILPSPIQSLFWLSGTVSYTVPFVVLSLFLGVLARSFGPQALDLRIGAILSGLFTFLAGGFAETYVAWQCVFLSLCLLAALSISGHARVRLLALLTSGLAGSIAAAAFVVSAPGNDARRSQLPNPLPLPEILSRSAADSRAFLADRFLEPEVLLIFLAAGLLTFVVFNQQKARLSVDALTLSLAFLAGLTGVFLLIGSSFAVSYYATDFPPPLRSLAPAVFSVVAFAVFSGSLLGLYAYTRASQHADLSTSKRAANGLALGLLVVVTAALVLPATYDEVNRSDALASYAADWDRRDRQIKDARRTGQEDLVVRALPHPGGFVEITQDPSVWINACMADYYDVKTIRAE